MSSNSDSQSSVLRDLSVRCQNFKCFGEGFQVIEAIMPVNIVIGRNNSGKTALLDVVEHVIQLCEVESRGHKGNKPEVVVSEKLQSHHFEPIGASESVRLKKQNLIWNFNPHRWAQTNLVGSRLEYVITENDGRISECRITEFEDEGNFKNVEQKEYIQSRMSVIHKSPTTALQFSRLGAERDIVPEKSTNLRQIAADGSGFTNLIRNYLNNSDLPEQLIDKELLTALNEIFYPDATFQRITVQEHLNDEGKWQIFLEESSKGRIPLSQTGSGVKTVLLVLGKALLMPIVENRSLAKYVFGFEELENNLHPALQRRLFRFLRELALSQGCHFFITTHSNVVIDLFSKDESAQILHVTHDGEKASVTTVKTKSHGHRILDDLDVRASDLLQANAIVWVEGPSDRIYFNRWVDLWSDGLFKEGVHYQCSMFGGSLAAHLTFDTEYTEEELIQAININRHVVFIADSDRSKAKGRLKERVKRLRDEVNKVGGHAWITKGREVENYIPAELFAILLKRTTCLGPDSFERVTEFIREKKKVKTLPDKVELARAVDQLLTKRQLEQTLDLRSQLNEVCKKLAVWNQIEWPQK